MVGLDDFALVLSCPCDHFARIFPPFSIHLLEVVGSCPLFYYPFIVMTLTKEWTTFFSSLLPFPPIVPFVSYPLVPVVDSLLFTHIH